MTSDLCLYYSLLPHLRDPMTWTSYLVHHTTGQVFQVILALHFQHQICNYFFDLYQFGPHLTGYLVPYYHLCSLELMKQMKFQDLLVHQFPQVRSSDFRSFNFVLPPFKCNYGNWILKPEVKLENPSFKY